MSVFSFLQKTKKSSSDDLLGQFRFRFRDEGENVYEDDLVLQWKDFNDHLLITGGSGSGKTSTVLQQLYEGIAFRACETTDSILKERHRVGGLIIEAKGDFTAKTQVLAKRYQRENSVIYFGPDHPEFVYDPWGDPEELPLQKAHKMSEILKAASGGKEGSDPFWTQAAQKLMTNIFLLHEEVRRAGKPVPSLSFHYLQLLCMDKGGAEGGSSQEISWRDGIKEGFQQIRKLLLEFEWEFDEVWSAQESHGLFLQKLTQIRESIIEMQSSHASGFENQQAKKILLLLENTREDWGEILSAISLRSVKLFRGKMMQIFQHSEQIQITWKRGVEVLNSLRKPGPLLELLADYETILLERGGTLEWDLIASYFRNEYLNPANEKTSASVSMMVSNALMPFVTKPFDRLFGPKATFDFTQVIDEGKLVVLDMPSAQYGVTQLLASLLIKIDFFRKLLNRTRLRKSGGEKVNQERHLIYLCDEFGSVATSGDQTGEASFLDKVREYRCSCLLAMQGLPSLLRKFPEKEVDALLQNCGIKIFLRNDDPSTNEYASRSLGTEIKVRLNQNTGAIEHFMDTQKKWGSRAYSTHYERQSRFSSDQFVSFRIGEGVLRLPSRFENQMVRKVRFDFHPIIEKEGK